MKQIVTINKYDVYFRKTVNVVPGLYKVLKYISTEEICTNNWSTLWKYSIFLVEFSNIILFMDVISYDIKKKADTCFP
jgi:hypothetical protein